MSYPDETPADLNDNPTKQYHYENTTYIHHLTGITDEEGNRYATYTYDSLGRGLTTEHAGGAEKVEILEYGSSFTRIRNALGKETKFNFSAIGSAGSTIERVTSVEGEPSTNCDGASSSTTYDANGFKNVVTDFSGNVIDYDYDTKGFEFKRVEAPGTDEERTILSTWIIPTAANLFQRQYLPDTIKVVDHKITDYDYDAKGRIDLITETDLKTAGSPTRAWDYGYTFHFYDPDGNGIDNQTKVATITVNGPRTDISDVTTQTFNTTGALLQVTNALGQNVVFSDHNAEGLPETITDANGVITELRYTTRGWLDTKTVKISPQDAVTNYDYYDNGLVKQITLPNGIELNYLYDEAQRLTTVTNGKGERIEYTLNDLGNKEAETIYSNTNDIKRQQERAFDELGRLLKNFGLNNQELEKFSYDGNGNVTQIANNNLISIVQVFDGLNRLKQVTDRANGETVYAYDDLDQLTSVTDPNDLQTTYSYNGFGFLTQLNSPDTGITSYTSYDLAGNLKSKTDARNVTTQYGYDALNRLTTVSFPANTSQNYTFAYDDTTSGNKGIGRRTGVTMANGSSIAWVYNNLGDVTQDTRVIDGKTLTTSYQYDLANNLTQITYPSGRIVNYVRDIDTASVIGVTTKQNASAATETIVSNVLYEPFGPVASMTFGDGFTQANTYDLLYRPDSIITTGANNTTLQSLNYDYDLVGTLNPITDNLNSAKNQVLTYDDLYRLTDADGGYGTYHYGYDPVGNRTAQTLTNSTANFSETLTYPLTSNKLQSVTGGSNPRSLSYTAAGNLSNDGRSFTYDDNNRLISVQNGATTLGSYEHNPLGQRDSKTTSGGSTQFVYNLAGQLLHEESTDPLVKSRDYIYLDGMTLAIVDVGSSCQPGGPCAAACAAEGTQLVTQLDILRDFRDDVLKPTALGQWLVSAYYHNLAPKAVEWMRQSDVNKTIVRAVMLPAIALAWTADFVQHSWQSLALFGLAIGLYLQATLSSGFLFFSRKILKIAALGVLFVSGFSWGDDIYFVHSDHLGTPQIVTDKNKNVVWKGEYTPFGEVKEVVKQIEQPLRFPGQYYDAETGLIYNMARDYDPSTGRYIQSDPIGFAGGLNTYAYVEGNPMMFVDPMGLLTTYYGGEGHFFGGGGLTTVTCDDECGKEKTFRYMKVCFGGAIGFSGGGGVVGGMSGTQCNRDTYKGWFFEMGGSYGYGGGGVDIGYNSDGPFGLPGSLSGVNEGGVSGGFGAKGKATWCYYIPLD